MKSYQKFIFESYRLDAERRQIQLNYSLDGEEEFQEIIELPSTDFAEYDSAELEAALFGLHLIAGISYYKTCLPKELDIKSGQLSPDQAHFWNAVYQNGLGEFFYHNQIDFRDLIKFPAQGGRRLLPETTKELPKKILLPFGGGKDSLASLEILAKKESDITLFRMGSHPLIDQLVEVTNRPILTVERHLSPNLFELNKLGALNGHVPFTTYLSFLSVVVGILYGFDAVVVSEEKSASYGNVEYLGQEINHQWSKSWEAEQLIREYIGDYLTQNIQYINVLRPFSELLIAKLVSNKPEYLPYFTSCNTNWKIAGDLGRRWCGECPKCAFTFTIFAAFVPAEQLVEVFGKNLFEDANLMPLFRELLGLEGIKPFECVGTPEETQAALYLAIRQPEFAQSLIGKFFSEEILPTIADPTKLLEELTTLDNLSDLPKITQNMLQDLSF